MVDSINDTAPDPEDLAEEEGGSGMPMTAAELTDADEADEDDEDDETSDEIDDDEDETEGETEA